MSGFTKLFGTLVTSTIWREDDKTRVVWITMLALADRHGYVAASVPGLAAMANVATEECRAAIERLKAPDRDSRTKDREGRRLDDADGGWTILNYAKYRELGRSVDRTEYLRIKKQESRSRKSGQPMSTNGNHAQPISEAEAEAEADNGSETDSFVVPGTTLPPVLAFPCNGDPGLWPLTQWQIDRWTQLYPGVDVLSECRKALAWVEANHRKTARGMLAYLNRWIGKANDQRRGTGFVGGKTSNNLSVMEAYAKKRGIL